MCLVVIAVRPVPGLALVVAANRDELHARPSSALAAWPDAPQIVAGRDLEAGGTWLGVTAAGRFASVTNVRSPEARREGRSRGELVRTFLESDASPELWTASLAARDDAYPAFNLIVADRETVLYTNERGEPPVALGPGIHGLSNARMDVPWPKVSIGQRAMARAIAANGDVDTEMLFTMLRDETKARDEDLPATGVPLEVERFLSSVFLRSEPYGTRCSTVVVRRENGRGSIEEQRFDAHGEPTERTRIEL
jgi:uncharacterized protein with NRDE domain